jgi:serine/threonine protein kinase
MENHRLSLPAGYRIENYEVQAVLGKGGFGITYVAYDWTLGRHMAIKELLPDTIATRVDGSTVVAMGPSHEENWQWARERFVEEARILAGFRHPNIIAVHRLIEANGTVYLVMDHLEGESYEARLRRIGREPDQASLMAVIGPLLDGLQDVHAAGLLHRDIKPENILFDKRGNPVLIDFGSARSAVGATMTMTSIVTHGYSPIEQYQTRGKMGPWTDIYASAAVMARAISGDKPPVASDRIVEDDYQGLTNRQLSGFTEDFLKAVDLALQVRPEVRPDSIQAWTQLLWKEPSQPSSPNVPALSTEKGVTIPLPDLVSSSARRKWNPMHFVYVGIVAIAFAGSLAVVFFVLVKATRNRETDTKSEAESAPVASVQPAAESPVSPTQTGSTAAPERAQPDPALVQKISRLVADSDRSYRSGDFETALKDINEAADLLPDDPGILLRRARLLESMQQPADAAADYARVAALPGLSAELRSQTELKLTQLGCNVSGSPVATPAANQTMDDAPAHGGADVREDEALQPGSQLGVVGASLRDGSPGTKILRITTKARPGITVDSRQVKMHVFFYEKDTAGDIQLTESKVVSQWLSPPVNWADNEPELLDVTYILPDSNLPGSAASNGSSGRTFLGYLIGIYYNHELQDTRADPSNLAKKFPLPLYLKQEP